MRIFSPAVTFRGLSDYENLVIFLFFLLPSLLAEDVAGGMMENITSDAPGKESDTCCR